MFNIIYGYAIRHCGMHDLFRGEFRGSRVQVSWLDVAYYLYYLYQYLLPILTKFIVSMTFLFVKSLYVCVLFVLCVYVQIYSLLS